MHMLRHQVPRDGAWRHIVVRTPARDDLLVRHKAGYYAARG